MYFSQTNSTQSLVQGSKVQAAAAPSLTPPHITPHTFTSSHLLTTPHNSHLPPSFSLTSSTSLSSLRSTQSELAPPSMTSSRRRQQHTSTYKTRDVASRKRESERTGKKTERAKKEKSRNSYITSTSTSEAKSHLSTPRAPDSGYSSGGVVSGRSQLTKLADTSGGSRSDVAVYKSPSLSLPTSSVTVPVTLTRLHLTGPQERRGDGEGVERGRVRQLEHEVAVLEQQLSEKTQAARSHVEELTCVRSELARERAALARVSLLWW